MDGLAKSWVAEDATATLIFSSISSQRKDFTINSFEWLELMDFSKSNQLIVYLGFARRSTAEYRYLWGTDLASKMTTSIASAWFIFAYEYEVPRIRAG